MCKELTNLTFCLVLVLALAAGAIAADPFRQDQGPDGIISMEAENFDENVPRPPHTWDLITAAASGFAPPGGFTGGYAMQSTPTTPAGGAGFNDPADFLARSPRLDYKVNFIKTGTHYVWVLAWGLDGNSDSIHSGLDGQHVPTADRIGVNTSYAWTNTAYQDPERIMIDVTSAGVHTFNIWMREDGSVVDKIVLTTNPDYRPTGAGPEQSHRGPLVKAYKPLPADGSQYLDTWATLSWTPGETAVSHDVYFGESFTDVNDGTGSTFRGNQPSAFFVVGFPGFPYPDGLVPGTTYYWRIDEVEAGGKKHKGDVWSFTIPPRIAYNPAPADGARFVTLDTTLSWAAGLKAKLHYVYFGANRDTVAGAAGALPQSSTTYTPSALALDTVYYWRVDEFDGAATHKGNVWSFKTLPQITVSDPNLVGWWKLDEGSGTTAIDWSGHGNKGTLNGGPKWTEGYDGGALAFDGGDYVELPTGMAGSDVGSVTLWIKTTQTDRGMIFYGSEGTSGNGYGDDNELHVNVENGGVAEFIIEGGDTDAGVETANISNDSWQHIAATWDITGQVTIYLNGGSPVSVNHTAHNFRMTGRIRLGGPNANERYYLGLLDDVRLYNKVLSVAEITEAMRGDPLLAWNAKPTNGSTVNFRDATPFTWSPGDKASQHDVYFGSSKDAVAKADVSDTTGIYRGRQSGTSYTPPEGVQWGGGPYYWRIDEVNTDATVSTGRIWSFLVSDFILVENFESYDGGDNQIWYAWHDGLGYGVPGTPPYFAGNGTGSAVGDETTGSFTEETIVHGGSQSMPLAYDNNKQGFAKYSEAELTLSYPRDWTEGTVGELSLWFRGRAGSVGSFVEGPVGTYTMTASGADIWNQADQFHFAYKTLSGAGSIEAQVLSVDNTDPWAKAGVMIRETLDAGSKFAAVYITPANGCRFQARATADAAATSDTAVVTPAQTAIKAPYWVKIERDVAGNFKGYYSSNGTSWTPMTWNPQSITMGSNVYIGLVLTSHNNNATCTAKFSGVKTAGTVSPQWANQDIGIISNAAEPLYVAVSNAAGQPAVVVHSNTNAATTTTWTEWVIPLSAFADKGINLKNVDRLAIGLGTRGNMTAPGGSGKMYFDDLRLYRPRTSP